MPKPQGKLTAFLAELRRRRVFRVAAVYSGVAFCLAFTALWGQPSNVWVVPLPGEGIAADVEVARDGTLHMAYVDGSDVVYVVSRDGGQNFSPPLRVNSQPGTVAAGAFRGPDVALGPGGRIHVIWYSNAYQTGRPQLSGVHYAYKDPHQERFVPSRNLNSRGSDNFSLAVSAEGEVVVTWTAGKLYIQQSRDNGKTFSPPLEPLTSADPCECCATRTLFTSQDSLYIFYREKRNNQRNMHLLHRTDPRGGFTLQQVSQTNWELDGCPMTGASLAGSGNDGLWATWETRGQVYLGRLGGDGRYLEGGELLLSTSGKYPLILKGPRELVVAWKDGSLLRWKLLTHQGELLGAGEQETASYDRPGGAAIGERFVLFP